MPHHRAAGQETPGRWARRTLLALSGAGICAAGCRSAGPTYNRPPAETPSAWKEPPPDGWKNATPSDDIGKGNWWEIFGESELNDLETQAIAANQNLKA